MKNSWKIGRKQGWMMIVKEDLQAKENHIEIC